MKKYILLPLISIILLISLNINVQSVVADETNPCTIYGTVKDENGIVLERAIITVENLNTKEKNSVGNDTITGSPIPVTTNSHGIYTFELINLKNGFNDGDEIIVTAEKEGEIGCKSIIVREGSWGVRADIIVGIEEKQGKELWYSSLSNIWILFIIVIPVVLILLFVMFKRHKPKKVSPSSAEAKKKLPSPPSRHKSEKDTLSFKEEKEPPPLKDEILEDELPHPEDDILEEELSPPEDEIPEEELPPPEDELLEELQNLEKEISELELPHPEDEKKPWYGSLSRIGILYIPLAEIIVIILMFFIKSNIEVL